MKLRIYFIATLLLFSNLIINATTIIPFNNLGHLASSCDEVVIATVINQNITEDEDFNFDNWNLKIEHSFKSNLNIGDIINLESMNGQSSSFYTRVAGEIQLEVGNTYLLFLDHYETGEWKPKTLSYYLYKSYNNGQYFVPVKEGLEIHVEGESDGIMVIDGEEFISYMSSYQNSDYTSWDDRRIMARGKLLSDFYPELRDAPSHCENLFGSGTGVRWDIFPNSALEVYCDTEVDNGYAGSHTAVGNAIIDLNNSYSGINISNEGVVNSNYNPNCSGGEAQGGNFSSYSNGLNGGDNLLVIFNDPCNQIPNLNSCSGTLAFGGTYGSSPYNQHDGQDWWTARNAYVIVNNGVGSCLSASGYKSMLTHEMTHGLGLGHIASSFGAANMNPSCCTDITALDIECLDYLYPPAGGGVDLNLITTVDNVTCFGYCNAYISVDNVTNGVAPYSYSWDSGQNTSSINNLCPGLYTVTVTDNVGNDGIMSFNITQPNQLTVFVSANSTSCGDNNGSASAFPDGGTTPYSYSWSTGSTNTNISNLSSGNYSVTIVDANNCNVTKSFNIAASTAMTANASATDETSNNANNGTATCSPSGGNTPYNYSWSNGQNTQTITGLSPGTYTVTITDNSGCNVTEVVAVAPFSCPSLAINSSKEDASCYLSCDGSISIISVTNGVNPLSYSWSNGATTSSISNLCATNFVVTVTDADDCTVTKSFNISEPTELFANISTTDETGNNFNDGTATSSPSNGNSPYSYIWTTGATTSSISGLSPGNYTVTVTDASGCEAVETSTVFEFVCPTLTIISLVEDASCYGDCNGSITINSITNGTAPYTYEWSTGSTNSNLLNLCAGTYTVTITDSKECEVVGLFTVLQPDNITTNPEITHTTCGLNNGIIILNTVGGEEPYSYNWSNGSTSSGDDGLASGNYTVTVTDSEGCSLVETFEVLSSSMIIVNASATNETANNANDGTATCNPTSGNPSYTYLWNNGTTTQSISGLEPGNYTVTVTDSDGCSSEETVTVTEFGCPVITLETEITNILCNGECTASIAITTVENGESPFTYEWSTEDTNASITNLCAGTYTVTIVDAVNCSLVAEFIIEEPLELETNITSTNETANNTNNGTASVSLSGGITPYSYAWSNGETTASIDNLNPGSYYLTVTDANDCTKLDTAIIDEYICPTLVIIETLTNINCYNECNGSISINVENGVSPYTYSWSNGNTTNTVDELCAGNYEVTVTDSKNCSITTSVTIVQPEELLITTSSTPESNNNANDGTATVDIVGGTPSYTYLWSNGASTQSIDNLPPDSYTVTVSDANGCTTIGTVSIGAFGCTDQIINITQTNVSCNGACDGILDITSLDNAEAPYSYLWNNGNTTNIISALCPDNYSVTVTDGNGCSIFNTYNITEPNALVTNSNYTNETSYEANDGTAISNPSGGTPPYSFTWSNGETSQSLSNLSPGEYIVEIIDNNTCTISDTIVIEAYICDPFDIIIDNISNITSAESGEIEILLSEGNYNYIWSGPNNYSSNEEDIYNLTDAGCYTVIATNSENNCSQDTTICIEDYTATFDEIDDITINLYPNPNLGDFTIDFSNSSISDATITIYDNTGKTRGLVTKQKEESYVNIDINSFEAGLYFIKISTHNGFIYKKIVLAESRN